MIDKTLEQHTGLLVTRQGKVQVIDEEKECAPTIEWDRLTWGDAGGGLAARSRELGLFISAPRHDSLEKRNVPGLAVNLQNKLAALQAIYESALFVEDHYVCLHQRCVDPYDVRTLAGSSLLLRKPRLRARPTCR